MNLLNLIWDWFRKPKAVPIVDNPLISSKDVKEILSNFTDNIWISDKEFQLINTDNLKEFLTANPVDTRAYYVESHDCDEFSFELMGDVQTWLGLGAFGIVWGNKVDGTPHAWNFIIDDNKQVMYIEPQTDYIFEPTTENVWIMIL